jgi:hypothetical protein
MVCVGVGGVEGGRRSGRCRRSSRRGGLWVLLVEVGGKGLGAEIGRGKYPTSISTNVVASRTFEPFVPPWGFAAFSSVFLSYHISISQI